MRNCSSQCLCECRQRDARRVARGRPDIDIFPIDISFEALLDAEEREYLDEPADLVRAAAGSRRPPARGGRQAGARVPPISRRCCAQ